MAMMAAAGTVGAACTADSGCTQTSASCVLAGFNSSWPDGYCTVKDCGNTTTCPDGSFCQPGHMGLGPACMYKCTADTDCRAGYKCCDVTDPAAMGTKVCAPAPYLCN
jgi:hypothetical protein